MDEDSWIEPELYSSFLQRMPQASVELLLECGEGVLLVKRTNPPAEGEWFIPGSRLHKGESFEEAVHRIANDELSVTVEIVNQLGAYNHFWETGRLPVVESTHTVNVVYQVVARGDLDVVLDDQHDDLRIVTGIEPELHPYIRQYLRDSDVLGR